MAEKRENGTPGQLPIAVAENLSAPDPCIDRCERASQEGIGRLRRIQIPKPAAEGGRVGYTIGILHRRRRRFPGTALDKVAPQRRTASDQAVMSVRKREHRQEGNRLAANTAPPPPNSDPVGVFVMSLFLAAAMTDDRIAPANRALAEDHGGGRRPIRFELALRRGK